MSLFGSILSQGSFMPHGHCFLWNPALVWINLVSDVLIGMSYYSIPTAGLYYWVRRRDIPLWLFLLYASIFVACGSTHFMGAYTIWIPAYWESGMIKVATAVVSVAAAVALVPLIPKALALPSLKKALEEIRSLNEELEKRVRERTAQLEASNKELEAFAYSVSHDLRAPLRGMDGFSKALLEDYSDRIDETGRDYLERIRAASRHMAELIDEMLQLSRITRSEIRREKVDLSARAREIARGLAQRQPERRVDIVIKEGLTAEGDPQLLEVVLDNLLGNAWKFTSRHETARIEFGSIERDGRRVYFVRDDGAGFDPAYAGRLFAPFQRLHAAREFEGTGIGLATVQRIIRRHGGEIWAEGAVEKGATFYFTL